jgi:outer membrane protein assembly factor BamA
MKLLVALVFLFAAGSCAAVEITFAGARPSNDRQLQRLADRLPLDSAQRAIQSNLNAEGYLGVTATANDGVIQVHLGPRYYLSQLIVQDSIVDTVDFVPTPFTERLIRAQFNRILSGLESQGYYFASATAQDFTLADTLVALVVKITRGPIVSANSYVFGGLQKTPASLLERYLPPLADQPITPQLLEEITTAAERIPFVTFVPSVDIRPREGYTEADLYLTFIERRQFRIEGIAGYVPSTESGLLWTLDARFQNILGGGREAFVTSERRERGRNLLDIGYSQPVFFAGVGVIGGEVSTRDYRDEFYEFAMRMHYDLRFAPQFQAGVAAGWRNVEPNGNLAAYNAFSIGLNLKAANQSSPYGEWPYYSLAWSVGYSYRRYKDDSLAVAPQLNAVNETRTSITLSSTWPIYKSLGGHLSATYMGLETPEDLPPISELYLLGGPGTVRGFRNDRFLAQRAAIGVIEPRLRFDGGFAYLFVDGAYINLPVSGASGEVFSDESFHAGYGIGIDIRNASRAVDISLGWNRDLSFDQPRLSVQFISDI